MEAWLTGRRKRDPMMNRLPLRSSSTTMRPRSRRPRTSDRSLLLAWRDGDRVAGDRLLRRHWAPIHGFFHRRVARDHEELVQRTFLACIEGCSRIRNASGFRSYLYGVANNVLRDHLRRSYRAVTREHRADRLECDGLVEPTPDPRRSTPALIDDGRDRGLLLRALERLSPAEQLVLQMSYWEQMSSAEIAQHCGVPSVTVRGRLHRARRELLRQMERLSGQASCPWATSEELETWARDVVARSRERAPSSTRSEFSSAAPSARLLA